MKQFFANPILQTVLIILILGFIIFFNADKFKTKKTDKSGVTTPQVGTPAPSVEEPAGEPEQIEE